MNRAVVPRFADAPAAAPTARRATPLADGPRGRWRAGISRRGRPFLIRETATEGGDPVKTITIRKAGAVRLTAPANYCYGCCCCIRQL
jgi:hypothetical protein